MPWRRERLPTPVLAWRMPWTVWSMRSQRVGHNWATFTFHRLTWNHKGRNNWKTNRNLLHNVTFFFSLIFKRFILFLTVLGGCCTGLSRIALSSLVAARGPHAAVASPWCGFSRWRAQALGGAGFSSCGTWAQEMQLPDSRSQAQ